MLQIYDNLFHYKNIVTVQWIKRLKLCMVTMVSLPTAKELKLQVVSWQNEMSSIVRHDEYLKSKFLNLLIISVKLTLASSEFNNLNVIHLSEWRRKAYIILHLRLSWIIWPSTPVNPLRKRLRVKFNFYGTTSNRRFPYIPDNEWIRTSIGFLNQ